MAMPSHGPAEKGQQTDHTQIHDHRHQSPPGLRQRESQDRGSHDQRVWFDGATRRGRGGWGLCRHALEGAKPFLMSKCRICCDRVVLLARLSWKNPLIFLVPCPGAAPKRPPPFYCMALYTFRIPRALWVRGLLWGWSWV